MSETALRAKAWLASPRSNTWIVLLGVALTLPSLGLGLVADDYIHALVLRRLPLAVAQRGPWDLFRFANGDARLAHVMMDRGQMPWTSDPSGRFAFFRPLAAVTHVFDYAIWPDSPWLMHAQNVAWYGLALAAVAALFRRLFGRTWVAGLALFLFAVDHTHGPAVGWIAGRNALIALALGVPVITLHDRWRRDGWKAGSWLAPLLLGVALFAGESALAIGAYLAAYAVHLEQGRWRARLLALAPYLPVVVVWRTTYAALGYGVFGSDMYLDPAGTPLAFVAALPQRLPQLLAAELAAPPSDASVFYEYVAPWAPVVALAFVLLVILLLGAAMVPLWRTDPLARFFTTGLILAALPVCAAFPSNRLLLYVSIGASGLIAQRIARPGALGANVASLFLILFHVVLSPVALALGSSGKKYERPIEVAEDTIPRTPEVATKTVILVNPPNESFGTYLWAVRALRGEPAPAHMYELAPVTTGVEVTRDDATSLRVRPAHGFLEHEAERILRAKNRPLALRETVQLERMSATVTALTEDGRPAEAVFRFDAPLEDPSFVWLKWKRGGYAPWVPPPIGATARLPAFDVRRAVLDLDDDYLDARQPGHLHI